MYLFVLFWSPALKTARALVDGETPPPFGLVFSTFMCAMMLGSQMSTMLGGAGKVKVPSVVNTLCVVLLIASIALTVSTMTDISSELLTLVAFSVFELCVGLYYPTIGCLPGEQVHGGIRGHVYGLLRLPLNVFVFFALLFTQEGKLSKIVRFMMQC